VGVQIITYISLPNYNDNDLILPKDWVQLKILLFKYYIYDFGK